MQTLGSRYSSTFFSPEADKGAGTNTGDQSGTNNKDANNQSAEDQKNNQPQEIVYEDWFKAQPEHVKKAIDLHTTGLKTALDSERTSRGNLEKQVRELATKAEKGSEAQTQLTQLADQLQGETQRSDFFEAAHTAGVTNLKLAYVVCQTDELFDKKGNVDFDQLKKKYPELFGRVIVQNGKRVKGGAGEGSDQNIQKSGDMNSFIRRASGRG